MLLWFFCKPPKPRQGDASLACPVTGMTPIQDHLSHRQCTRAPCRAQCCWPRATLVAVAAAMSDPRRKEDCMPTKPAAALEHPSSDYANQTLRQPWPRVASRPIKTRSSASLRAKADRHLHCCGWTAQASLLVHQPTGLVSERPRGFEGDGEVPAIRTAIVSQSEQRNSEREQTEAHRESRPFQVVVGVDVRSNLSSYSGRRTLRTDITYSKVQES
ncbi:hypothetical protein BKA81DRAFT_360343 [Phyllosticta paracitricarpa]|uniref:Uncharacterized protein n=1 Tax=Phyllosticta paracitricarpa TaxID=2016321 RepID=A0ABR1NLL5_9PEZI